MGVSIGDRAADTPTLDTQGVQQCLFGQSRQNSLPSGSVIRHLLEEQPWAVPVRILDGRSRAALLLRYADTREEVVPRGQRVGILGQVDSGRAGVDIAQYVAPEG